MDIVTFRSEVKQACHDQCAELRISPGTLATISNTTKDNIFKVKSGCIDRLSIKIFIRILDALGLEIKIVKKKGELWEERRN
jgi:hypothetical protein